MKVVYSGTKNLYPYIWASIQSLLDHNKVDKIYLLIEDDEFPYELPKNSVVMNMSRQKYFPETGINYRTIFTYMCLIRVCHAELFPKEDKIIQLDADTIVVDSIQELWDIDLTGKWFAMCPEYTGGWRPFGKDKVYRNCGVAVFNLKQIRKDNLTPKMVNYLNTTYARCMDQEAWNYFGENMAVDIPVRFNETPYTGITDNPAVVHYCGNINWQRDRKMFRHEYLDKYIDRRPRYMIHTCNDREWYVKDFLIPSMIEQGIPEDHITVWHDKKCIGNLASWVASCKWIGENCDQYLSTWHIQDDIVIGKNFAEMTSKYYEGIANGFCNEQFDGERTNYFGIVPASGMWFSFQCVLIPNQSAIRFAKWFEEECVNDEEYKKYVATGKCDDFLFRAYITTHEYEISAVNIWPCIVDHIDYLLGGSIINAEQRKDKPMRVAYWRDETLDEVVEELKEKLSKYKGKRA